MQYQAYAIDYLSFCKINVKQQILHIIYKKYAVKF